MNLISISNLSKAFDGELLFSGLQLSINQGDKIAIIGRNGVGKTTLARILIGEEAYDGGEIYRSANIKLGYFSQHRFQVSDRTVMEELQQVFAHLISLKQAIDTLGAKIEQGGTEADYHQYNLLLQNYEDQGGYEYQYRIETMIHQFGFDAYINQKVQQLSGGERTRLALAKLLLEEPDVLILDEPTNHLDLETVEFLESFLRAYKNAVILISHDRYFVNQIVNLVYEIEFKTGHLYYGNYDDYLIQKEARYEKMLKDYTIQQKMIKKELEFIEKNITRASTTKRAQARRKKLEKLTLIEQPRLDKSQMKLNFSYDSMSGNLVLKADRLTVGYQQPLIKNANFIVNKGEKIAIIGPNGTGKSTLLKTLHGTIPPLNGQISYGASLTRAYFDQDLAMVNSNKTVLDEIWDEHRQMLERDVRGLLGNFLFTGDDVFKVVNDLSGGEKVRLSLVKLFLARANLLILDEVTNHLDIMSKEILESALIDYDGTVIFVSHDRYFVNEVATRIIEINGDQLVDYRGDYQYYLFKKREQVQEEKVRPKEVKPAYDQSRQLRNQIRKLEKQVEALETEISQIEADIEALKQAQLTEAVYLNPLKSIEVQKEIDLLEQKHHDLIGEWNNVLETLSQLTKQ